MEKAWLNLDMEKNASQDERRRATQKKSREKFKAEFLRLSKEVVRLRIENQRQSDCILNMNLTGKVQAPFHFGYSAAVGLVALKYPDKKATFTRSTRLPAASRLDAHEVIIRQVRNKPIVFLDLFMVQVGQLIGNQ